MAVAPASTMAGVLGIVRTTRVPAGRKPSIAAIGMPAAIETTSASGFTPLRTSGRSRSKTCGLVASTTTSAARAASSFDVITRTPCFCFSSSSRALRTSVQITCSGVSTPEARSPLMSAPAMLPAPRKATVLSSLEGRSDVMRRQA
jgi:hypothetical protein